jgi:hypothetical protein
MLLKSGEKILVVHRRLFQHDRDRYFLGTIEEYEHGIAIVTGYTFVRDTTNGGVLRKDDLRTKIVPITSGSLIVYRLSPEFVVDDANVEPTENRLVLSDGHGFKMNISEHPH